MFENALIIRGVQSRRRTAYKTLISLALIALSVILPQIVHMAVGLTGGAKWLPMYLPVLIGGCILGSRVTLAVAVLSPLSSFALTSLFGEAMPAASRLPFMIVELCVFAFISGLFSKKIAKNALWAFAAVACAQIVGRAVFFAVSAVFSSAITSAALWEQIKLGASGLIMQIVLVPMIVIALRALLIGEKND